ncbi:unnamed protein product [Haemonchus placei]|uniref:Uncharacterized protein n=1 Tax=Haemonchus placei TaxID=6290 RepID=A0A0N4WSN3_HAEPC|nr:unnamed protein product [Haemonchus placei]
MDGSVYSPLSMISRQRAFKYPSKEANLPTILQISTAQSNEDIYLLDGESPKAREIGEGVKLFCNGEDTRRNGLAIAVAVYLKDRVRRQQILEEREGEKFVLSLAKARHRSTQDIMVVKSSRSSEDAILKKPDEVMRMTPSNSGQRVKCQSNRKDEGLEGACKARDKVPGDSGTL